MKDKEKFTSIDEYINTLPKDIREKLQLLRQEIKKAAPEAMETISYNMPAFRLNEVLVYFAAHKDHIGFYPTPSAIIEFEKELNIYKTSKGAIQFPLNKPLPFELIRKIVAFRVKSCK